MPFFYETSGTIYITLSFRLLKKHRLRLSYHILARSAFGINKESFSVILKASYHISK